MRKRLLAIIATAAMLVAMIPSMAFADVVTTINSVDDLKAFAKSVNEGESYAGKTVTLGTSLDISGIADWEPIGKGTRSGNTATPASGGAAFKGTFDGNGKIIEGLTITSGGSSDAVGLFGIVDGGVIKNLTLTEVNIDTSSKNVGAAIGIMVNDATADNISVSGAVTAPDGVGGVVGRMIINGTISNCTNTATVTTTTTGGGIVGKAYYTATGKEMNIENCSNAGTITAGYAAGGIVGLSTGNVIGCKNTAKITAGTEAGGIIGEQTNYGEVKNNNNSGLISNNGTGGTAYGGIIGWLRYQDSASDYPSNEVISVVNNVNSGNISAEGAILGTGGIVGSLYNQAIVTGNENTATSIVGGTFVAGIVGGPQPADNNVKIDGATINIYNNVTTTSTDKMSGTNVTTEAWNNSPREFVVEENNDTWVAQVGDTKYATFDPAIEAAEAQKKDLVILDMDGEENLDVPDGVKVVNKTGENITVNDATVAPSQNESLEDKKPEASPATGDNSMAPFAVAGLVLAAMAAVVATRRRYN